jgi:hypothetical protein
MKYNATAIQQHEAASLLNRNYRLTSKNILGDGVKLCRRAKAHNTVNSNTAQIAVHQHPNGNITSNMHDVALCGNAHLCSYCSSVKAAHMRNWINQLLMSAVKKEGLLLGLLTLTAWHQRECDWSKFVANFFSALTDFYKAMRRDFDSIGCIGRVRAIETPIGSNGLHVHPHDLFTYKAGTDMEAFKKIALKKWKSALRKYGLRCSKKGLDIMVDGTFDPNYIAKEIAAHDTKKSSKSDLKTMFQLLDDSARGDKQAGEDWIRAAKAIQGRDRFNVGQLANKLGIPSPSDWKKKEGEAKIEPANIIEYPQSQHLMATEPNSQRNGLAMILRTARQSLSNNMATIEIVEALCKDYTKQRLLNTPIAAAKALERNTNTIEQLFKLNAITQEVAEDLIERAIVEVDLIQQLKVQEINTKLQVALTPQRHVKANAELDFS